MKFEFEIGSIKESYILDINNVIDLAIEYLDQRHDIDLAQKIISSIIEATIKCWPKSHIMYDQGIKVSDIAYNNLAPETVVLNLFRIEIKTNNIAAWAEQNTLANAKTALRNLKVAS